MKIPFFIFCTLVLFSCKKEIDQPAQTGTWAKIESPFNGETFSFGDTIPLIASAQSEVQQHGYSFKLINLSNDSILYLNEAHVHGLVIDAQDFWINDLPQAQNLELIFTTYIDHSGSTSSDTVRFETLDK